MYQTQNDRALAPTISRFKQESNKMVQDAQEYKSLLDTLGQSDFVKEMRALQDSIIE